MLKHASQAAIRPIRDLFRPPPCSCWCCTGQPTTVHRPGRHARPQAPSAGDRPAARRPASTGRAIGRPGTHGKNVQCRRTARGMRLWPHTSALRICPFAQLKVLITWPAAPVAMTVPHLAGCAQHRRPALSCRGPPGGHSRRAAAGAPPAESYGKPECRAGRNPPPAYLNFGGRGRQAPQAYRMPQAGARPASSPLGHSRARLSLQPSPAAGRRKGGA